MPGARVVADAVLFDDPLEGGAVAEPVVVGLEGDAAEGEERVVAELGPVFIAESHEGDAVGDFGP
jgi:hypothetical protein